MEPRELVCEDCRKLIVPLRQPLCPVCGEPDVTVRGDTICSDCPEGTIHFAASRAATPFDSVARTIVEKLKYSGRQEHAPLMARYMFAAWKKEYEPLNFHVLVPVPLFRTRQRERGFNQSEVLGRELEKLSGVPLRTDLLKRTRATTSQTRLTRKERATNIAGAFAAQNRDQLPGQHILLVDDVYTTGATLNECARVLRDAGAESVNCLTFCRAGS